MQAFFPKKYVIPVFFVNFSLFITASCGYFNYLISFYSIGGNKFNCTYNGDQLCNLCGRPMVAPTPECIPYKKEVGSNEPTSGDRLLGICGMFSFIPCM